VARGDARPGAIAFKTASRPSSRLGHGCDGPPYVHGFDARDSPGARIIGIDRCARSLATARSSALVAGLTNVEFFETDIYTMPFAAESLDHVFGAFVLEHLARPLDALIAVKHVLRPGGTITLFEGDHGSVLMYPPSEATSRVIACQVELQRRAGGDALIGRRLHQLLSTAGFYDVQTWPRPMYVDGSRPGLRARVAWSFISMIEGVRDQAIDASLIDRESFDEGVDGLRRAIVEATGTFCYTFFKAVGLTSSS